jgi:hypothetical protein
MKHEIGKEIVAINTQIFKVDCPKTDIKSGDWVLDLKDTSEAANVKKIKHMLKNIKKPVEY